MTHTKAQAARDTLRTYAIQQNRPELTSIGHVQTIFGTPRSQTPTGTINASDLSRLQTTTRDDRNHYGNCPQHKRNH